jgi:cardiolipin synthase
MSQSSFLWSFFWTLHVLVQIALIVRVLLRPHREPASRIAWIVVIIAVPVVGILAYILLGETNIGRRRMWRGCARFSRGCQVWPPRREWTRRTCRPMCRSATRICFKPAKRSTGSIPSAATGRA